MAALEPQDVFVFFSPSGVKSALSYFSLDQLTAGRFVAIGETTKNALEDYVSGSRARIIFTNLFLKKMLLFLTLFYFRCSLCGRADPNCCSKYHTKFELEAVPG